MRLDTLVVSALLLLFPLLSGAPGQAGEPPRPADQSPAASADEAANPPAAGEDRPADAEAAAPQPSEGQPAEKAATSPDSTGPLPIEQLETMLQDVQEQLQAVADNVTPQRAQELGVNEDQLRQRVLRLQDLENAIQRRLTSRRRLGETQQTVARIEQEIEDFPAAGLETEPPYEVTLLDRFRDGLSTARDEAKAAKMSLETLESLVAQAEDRVEEARRQRRQVQDASRDAAQDGPPRQWRLEMAELAVRTAEHELAHAVVQLELAKLEARSKELRIQLLKLKIDRIGGDVVFTRAELDRQLAQFDERRDEFEAELRAARRADQANQVRLEEARGALQSARGDEQIRQQAQRLATREALAQTSSRRVELLQEQINCIIRFRNLWERRFALRQGPSEEKLAKWQQETGAELEELRQRREKLERRLQALRTARLEFENQLSSADSDQTDRRELDLQLRARQQREAQETDYLATLLQLERLTQRVADEVDTARRIDSWRQVWSRLLHLVRSNWNRELVVIDEQAIRLGQFLWALIVFVLLLLAVRIARKITRRVLLRRLREHAETSQMVTADLLLAIVHKTRPILMVLLAAYFALLTLPMSPATRRVLHSFAIIVVTIQAAIVLTAALKGIIDRTRRRRVQDDPSAAAAFGLIAFFAQVGIWSAALLLVLTNLGYEIGPLLAGLGVGGVAVAFALQSILGDIFCSIAIVLDKPFVVGDFIIVGDFLGVVENIGIKTTRIRSLSGEQIIFSNADLLGSRVRNFKRMLERRVAFSFGVVYETPVDKLTEIPGIVRTIIEHISGTRFDRAHFQKFGDFSLDFEVVYYVLSPDFNQYMDIQQEINLGMFRAFADKGISFAYPTREIIMRPNDPAKVTSRLQPEPSVGLGRGSAED